MPIPLQACIYWHVQKNLSQISVRIFFLGINPFFHEVNKKFFFFFEDFYHKCQIWVDFCGFFSAIIITLHLFSSAVYCKYSKVINLIDFTCSFNEMGHSPFILS